MPAKQHWQVLEMLVLAMALAYFLLYPRDTISDFLVCTSLCLAILASKPFINLPRPATSKTLTRLDFLLLVISLGAYSLAWYYAEQEQKISRERLVESLLVTALYVYYAWFQHFLAQAYTAVRIHQWVRKYPGFEKLSQEMKAAALTGSVFGVLHIPYPDLIIPATLGGTAYAYYFLKTGRLWAVVLSHALIASAWLYWGMDSNAFEEFTVIFPEQ